VKDFNEKIGKHIRELRKKQGYSREKLANLAGISDKFLYEAETGKKGVSAHTLSRLAASLGVTMDYLVSGKQDKKHSEIVCLLHDLTAKELHYIEDIVRSAVAFLKSCFAE